MTKAQTTESATELAVLATEFAVFLYPTQGRPRVVEIPKMPVAMRAAAPIATYATLADAEAALATFLKENPEYWNWVDGQLTPPHGA
jgi:hypothetical protein